jgi:hypothetical protein
MPSLLFCRELCRANPALLTLMHLSRRASVVSSTCVPPPLHVPTQMASMQQSAQESLQPNCDAGAVGEVWWLFDSGVPYLAEVFSGGHVPTGRLPHVDKGSFHGKHVARVLGRRHSFVKLVAHSARIILFTAWCAPRHWLPPLESDVTVLLPHEVQGNDAACAGHRQLRRRVPTHASDRALMVALRVWTDKLRAPKRPHCITCVLESKWLRWGTWT